MHLSGRETVGILEEKEWNEKEFELKFLKYYC